ncbi:MAG: putative metal-binding motif-containing protein [Sandaracinaceae bacterium]|nr:putative metal-binding motif-containing protein [Sandaracinaceae bacterium]
MEEGAVIDCEAPSGFVAEAQDCVPDDAAFYPGAPETDCLDPNDYNCDGSVGFADGDGDGFAACEECDDGSAAVNPDATEVCDGVDNNCDAVTDGADAADASTWYLDADTDGYGDLDFSTLACEQPAGYARTAQTATTPRPL